VLKDTDVLTVFFMLSGSTSVKAARKTLVKLIPGDQFSNDISGVDIDGTDCHDLLPVACNTN
jgi:hypothetical protein